MNRFRCEVHIQAKNLSGRYCGLLRPSPYAIVTITGGPLGIKELGRTEIIERSSNPNFTETFYLDHVNPVVHIPFIVSIHDASISTEPNSESLIAEIELEAKEVKALPGHLHVSPIGTTGTIYVTVEPCQTGESKGYVDLHIRGLEIKNIEAGLLGLGRTDPFLEIAKKTNNHKGNIVWRTIYRSETIDNHLNPYWDEFQLRLEKLCNCNLDQEIRLSVWDYQDLGNHRMLGQCYVRPSQLKDHLSERGNADRDTALVLSPSNGQEDTFTLRTDLLDNIFDDDDDYIGYLCVLKVDFYGDF